jgi:hypothetical protein
VHGAKPSNPNLETQQGAELELPSRFGTQQQVATARQPWGTTRPERRVEKPREKCLSRGQRARSRKLDREVRAAGGDRVPADDLEEVAYRQHGALFVRSTRKPSLFPRHGAQVWLYRYMFATGQRTFRLTGPEAGNLCPQVASDDSIVGCANLLLMTGSPGLTLIRYGSHPPRYRNRATIKADVERLLQKTSISRGTRTAGMSQAWVVLSRVLILLTVLLVLAMPWTEYFWHFDHFLRGSEDFELSLLAVATIFCLVVILIQHGKKSVVFILALRRWLSFIFQHDDPAVPGRFCGLIAASDTAPLPSPALGMYNLPIQI